MVLYCIITFAFNSNVKGPRQSLINDNVTVVNNVKSTFKE